jgi:dissimilatory sulfite reductase related protein
MPVKILNGEIIKIDHNGYMIDFCQWNHSIAEALARETGLDSLSDDHWRVIEFIQKQAFKNEYTSIRKLDFYGIVPPETLFKLFPRMPIETATKIAGVPLNHSSCG